jgi:hypothetical protein
MYQAPIWIVKKEYKTEPFLKVTLPKWMKWQKAWKNRLKHYTQTIMVSPLFGPEIVALYKQQNEKYDPSAQIKSKESAESLRLLLATE